MKRKLLLLLLFSCIGASSFASTLIQGNWRWRNNDGDENSATFKADQNIPLVITDLSVIRLRIRVENTGSAGETHSVGALRYSTSASGPFTLIGADANAAFEYAGASGAPVEKTPTTRSDFLTTTSGATTYAAGEYFTAKRDLSENINKCPVSAGTSSDLEFVIKPTSSIATNTTYYFLIENESSSGPHNLAVLSTAATLPVQFLSFQAKPNKNGNEVALSWSTTSEENNERFEIRRSVDAKNWHYMVSQSGKGNTEVKSSYSWTDQRPLNGVSYYQLTQVDFDGTSKVLATQSVNMKLDPSVNVQVFPNPTAKEINVAINNYLGKNTQAKLYAQDGKLIHQEQLENYTQTLNIKKMPSAGIYILKIVGDRLLVNKKVVIL